MSIIDENTRTAYATQFIAAAICTAVAGGTAGLIHDDMTGRHWVIILVLFTASMVWTPFLMLSLWRLSRQLKQTDILAGSATAYGFTQTVPPEAAARSFATKPQRRTTKDVH